jgi:hypothetical protein
VRSGHGVIISNRDALRETIRILHVEDRLRRRPILQPDSPKHEGWGGRAR